jgi:hypothetical protein
MSPVTHDLLATMLGTNRSSVSLAAGILQREKNIEYTHGSVTIVNRKNSRSQPASATPWCNSTTVSLLWSKRLRSIRTP